MENVCSPAPLLEIFNLLSCGVLFAKEGIITVCNRAAGELLGVFPEKLCGMPLAEIVPKGADDGITPGKTILMRGKNNMFCTGVEAAGGLVVFLEDISKPLSSPEDKNTIEILAKSYDGILVTDTETNILYVNEAYERITGIKVSEMRGISMRDLYNPVWLKESVAETVVEIGASVTRKQVTQLGTEIMVTGTPIFEDERIKMIVINVRNLDEIVRMQEELARIRQMREFYDLGTPAENAFIGEQVVTASQKMRDVFMKAGRLSNFKTNVLITGESGVGKEVVAKYIHENSQRRNYPFIVVNCGSIPTHLLESEMFGYTRGAFTGALVQGKMGLVEAADKGTLLLDEVGEMCLDLQVKLLRVLETKQITPLGAVKCKSVDVHVISATNKDLLELVSQGKFREDLFYRLNIINIHVPPLRERPEDIGPLCDYFIAKFNYLYGLRKKISPDAVRELQARDWPGNVRQLRNVIENIAILSPGNIITCDDLPWIKAEGRSGFLGGTALSLKEMTLKDAVESMECRIISEAAKLCKNTRDMAKKLGVHQSTLIRKMQRYGMSAR